MYLIWYNISDNKEGIILELVKENKIIDRIANKEPYRKIMANYNVKSTETINRIKNNNINIIKQKQTKIKQLLKDNYLMGLNRLNNELNNNKKIDIQKLSNTNKDTFNQLNLLNNKPTTISKSLKDYNNLNEEELLNQGRLIVKQLKRYNITTRSI